MKRLLYISMSISLLAACSNDDDNYVSYHQMKFVPGTEVAANLLGELSITNEEFLSITNCKYYSLNSIYNCKKKGDKIYYVSYTEDGETYSNFLEYYIYGWGGKTLFFCDDYYRYYTDDYRYGVFAAYYDYPVEYSKKLVFLDEDYMIIQSDKVMENMLISPDQADFSYEVYKGRDNYGYNEHNTFFDFRGKDIVDRISYNKLETVPETDIPETSLGKTILSTDEFYNVTNGVYYRLTGGYNCKEVDGETFYYTYTEGDKVYNNCLNDYIGWLPDIINFHDDGYARYFTHDFQGNGYDACLISANYDSKTGCISTGKGFSGWGYFVESGMERLLYVDNEYLIVEMSAGYKVSVGMKGYAGFSRVVYKAMPDGNEFDTWVYLKDYRD